MSTAVRPNGKLYRPRGPVSVQEFECRDDGTGIVVLRTHDLTYASLLASWRIREYELTPGEPHLSWWRSVPWDDSGYWDQSWIVDPERGVPVIYWLPAEW